MGSLVDSALPRPLLSKHPKSFSTSAGSPNPFLHAAVIGLLFRLQFGFCSTHVHMSRVHSNVNQALMMTFICEWVLVCSCPVNPARGHRTKWPFVCMLV